LAKLCKRKGPIKEPEAKYYIKTIAKTLKYCHDQGVSHRDLKAENILVGKEGRLKLIDFAFAFKGDKDTKVDTFCGTPSYMAPEIFKKAPHCPRKADIWALGILAYRLVIGELPFIGIYFLTLAPSKNDKVERLILDEDYPTEILKGCSKAFQEFIQDCLEKNPERRSSLSELLTEGWLAEK
jgi:serine/threonine protein kinase